MARRTDRKTSKKSGNDWTRASTTETSPEAEPAQIRVHIGCDAGNHNEGWKNQTVQDAGKLSR